MSKTSSHKRRIFVGDIQGCRAELEDLLERVRFNPKHDELHPVGDMVNRGPDSLGTLRLLRSIDAGGVLGNHDVHCLRVWQGTRPSGGRDTLDKLLTAKDCKELCGWLAKRPFVRHWPDVLMVHAAVHPNWRKPKKELKNISPFEPHPASDFATRARYCTSTGERPPSDDPPPAAPFRPWFENPLSLRWPEAKSPTPKEKSARSCNPPTIVFGHWSRMGLVKRPGLRGLDTGCLWGRKLTAWIAEEDRLVSVPARKQHSPMSQPRGAMPPGSSL